MGAAGESCGAEMEQRLTVHVRLASPADVPHILALIQQLADFERLAEMCVASESKLLSTLFNLPPFQGPTVLLLEVSAPSLMGSSEADGKDVSAVEFEEVVREVAVRSAIKDPQSHAFTSFYNPDRIVVGFVLFFPNYSTFLAKPGFYIEDLFVRECYRGQGLGTILLKTVAQVAVRLDYGRVEWCVLDWNKNAIKFYEGFGAEVLQEWRLCRLTGKGLLACGS